jgi:hypothetical protein
VAVKTVFVDDSRRDDKATLGGIVSDETAALKKLQDLSDRLDKARDSQRAAAEHIAELSKTQRTAARQVAAAKKTTVRAKKEVVRVARALEARRRSSSKKKPR